MAQEVFKRYEKKYLLSMEQYEGLKKGLREKMSKDSYGEYTICNIYFDTKDFELIRTSIEKPVYKEKLRLRSYGVPKRDDTVFIEIKKKYDGVVYKRRVEMTLKDAEAYLYHGIHPDKHCQIMRELDWFTSRYQLTPTVYLAYDREAYLGNEDTQLRVTFDRNIRTRNYNLRLGEKDEGKMILSKNEILMEVKIPGVIPLWMSHLFSELSIFPISFSKYGTYYMKQADGIMKGEQLYV